MAPGHGLGGSRKSIGSYGNFKRGLLVFSPGPQIDDVWPLATGGVGAEKIMVHMGNFKIGLPSWKAAMGNRLISGVNIVVWRL